MFFPRACAVYYTESWTLHFCLGRWNRRSQLGLSLAIMNFIDMLSLLFDTIHDEVAEAWLLTPPWWFFCSEFRSQLAVFIAIVGEYFQIVLSQLTLKLASTQTKVIEYYKPHMTGQCHCVFTSDKKLVYLFLVLFGNLILVFGWSEAALSLKFLENPDEHLIRTTKRKLRNYIDSPL